MIGATVFEFSETGCCIHKIGYISSVSTGKIKWKFSENINLRR
jgi:hypothetical protein